MKHWLHAFRPRTLPLAISSIITGSALAGFFHGFRWSVFGLALHYSRRVSASGPCATTV